MSAYIVRPAYCNRFEAQRSLDFAPGADSSASIDRALISVAETIEGADGIHRVFFPSDDTRYFDWPNQGGSGGGQYADPWRLWLDENDIACMTQLVAGGVSIGLDQVFLRPYDNPRKQRPYFTHLELDRSTSVSFGNQQQTPQYSIAISGTWGYGADADPAAVLAASVAPSDTAVTVSDGSNAGPGDLVVLGYGRGTAPFPASAPHAGAVAPFLGERVLVTDASPAATGLTQDGSGVTAADDSDQALQWTGSGQLNAGEVITLDAEDMLVLKIVGSIAVVRRAFNGTSLAEHSGAVIWAMRRWSVLRGQLGTTPGTYDSGDMVARHRVPQLIRDLAIAGCENRLLQEGSGYARTVGAGDSAHPAPGAAMGTLWFEARTRHGRKGRQRTV